MAVYVDEVFSLRGNLWCHMLADSSDELEQMAEAIGIPLEAKQKPGTPYEHYDLKPEMRERALAHGAKEMSWQELNHFINRKKAAQRNT